MHTVNEFGKPSLGYREKALPGFLPPPLPHTAALNIGGDPGCGSCRGRRWGHRRPATRRAATQL